MHSTDFGKGCRMLSWTGEIVRSCETPLDYVKMFHERDKDLPPSAIDLILKNFSSGPKDEKVRVVFLSLSRLGMSDDASLSRASILKRAQELDPLRRRCPDWVCLEIALHHPKIGLPRPLYCPVTRPFMASTASFSMCVDTRHGPDIEIEGYATKDFYGSRRFYGQLKKGEPAQIFSNRRLFGFQVGPSILPLADEQPDIALTA